ncbi:MAG: peptide deformylase [Chthoniobacterales bacterium]|nr:peptide deformylase [Chthoniobacterales bacterium]
MLDLFYYGHPVLRSKGRRIEKITPSIERLAEQMVEAMYEYDGCGLAAQQIGSSLQLAVIDVVVAMKERPSKAWMNGKQIDLECLSPMVLVNPEIIPVGNQTDYDDEACLSIPEVRAKIKRPTRIKLRYQSLDGEQLELEAEGLLARAAMHEVDHLNGILFIDHLSAHELQKFQPILHQLMRENSVR